MNAALLAAVAELDALRLAAADPEIRENLDDEIYEARRRVWRLERKLAESRRRKPKTRAQRVRELYAYCLARRPELRAALAAGAA